MMSYIENKKWVDLNISSIIESSKDAIDRDNRYFTGAEHWLNYQGIETRTEYGNLLPTYNLFLKIGEWLERQIVEENDE